MRLWDLNTDQELRNFQGYSSVALSHDGRLLAAASKNDTAWVRNIATGEEHILQGHRGGVNSVSFSPDSNLLATSDDNTVRLWNTATGQQLPHIFKHKDYVWSVVFSPDGKKLATASAREETARLWDVETGNELPTHDQGHGGRVWRVVFSPDGNLLATASEDGTARLWNSDTGKRLKLFRHEAPIQGITFSPDGKLLATASNDNTAWVWNIANDKQPLQILPRHEKSVETIAFSSDGQWIATGSRDNTARVWITATGDLLYTLDGHQNSFDGVKGIIFSPSGKHLVTAASDKVLMWQVGDIEDMLAINCNWVRHYLENNSNVEKTDRHLCDNIPPITPSQQITGVSTDTPSSSVLPHTQTVP